MKQFETLLYVVSDNVCTITLNRPEVYNAFNEQMKKELNEALKEAEKDNTVRCIVLSGSGEKAFCSGQDLKEYGTSKRSLKESLEKNYNPIIRKIRTMEKPVIAMINGVAAGAGCSLALACDMRFMSSTARLIEIFVRIALIPDTGSHWFLPRLVGMAKAFEYMATGRDITAEEAERVGIANYVFPPAALEAETMAFAKKMAQAPTKTIGLIKRTLNKALVSDLDSLLDYEAQIQQIASETEDHQEGVKAFLEKRQAVFQGC
ncbi:MAG: 2-(1,2-epoxy-1,2-dihydrophenyl)acetyl-CoA isomerase [Bacteroidetes bacterium]|nr:MAG: 2-(1,2-epoxy-1,2-dihydrophenyl)acetyl-CoA isomerase [Bacteroidota bacterium]